MRRATRSLASLWLPATVDAGASTSASVLPALTAAHRPQRWAPPSSRRPITGAAPEFGRTYTERKLLGCVRVCGSMVGENSCIIFQNPFFLTPIPTTLISSYTPDQLFDVVADVGAYSQFVPWCVSSTVLPPPSDDTPPPLALPHPPPDHATLDAELRIGFNSFAEAYTSTVTLARPHTITSTVRGSAVFHHLDCVWRFAPGPLPATVWLSFGIDFAFKSAVYRHAASLFFDQVAARMVSAFEGRCGELYGPPSVARRPRRGGVGVYA
jgi:coenzyme Q-binding protein COQ10